jgi:putative ABC transport system permease protein
VLELKNIKKTYTVGEIETKALNGINVAFREREFVAILGASGSGKTTCLNIIGGLDRYDADSDCEMTIKGKKTASFKDSDWDAYRNNSVGFVFQSYNLITHLSIVANVELGMTLSGVSSKEKRDRAIEVLTEVGLKEHLHKKPNQLSGGQMQRVAIARSLANNPEILLCDEPTGALDSKTSKQIMNLIRDLSKERLVIMVTHNADIAEEYADRTVKFDDGLVVSDSNPHTERPKEDGFNLKKTAMSFLTALNLSGNNILTKKGRTFLTSFASSIGIIGIAVILSLSNGFQLQIDKFQEDALSEFPIALVYEVPDFNHEEMQQMRSEGRRRANESPTEVVVFDPLSFYTPHINVFTPEYVEYIHKIDPEICSSVGIQRMVMMNVIRKDGDEIRPITVPSLLDAFGTGGGGGFDMGGGLLSSFPKTLGVEGGFGYLERNYELLHGEFPKEDTDLVLIVGRSGRLEKTILESLGFDTDRRTIPFEEIVNTELKLVCNNDFFNEGGLNLQDLVDGILEQFPIIKSILPENPSVDDVREALKGTPGEGLIPDTDNTDGRIFSENNDFDAMWESENSLTLRVAGVLRSDSDSPIDVIKNGIIYSDTLLDLVIERSMESKIVKALKEEQNGGDEVTLSFSRHPLMIMNLIPESQRDMMPFEETEMKIQALGGGYAPLAITLYPNSFDSKDALIEYLEAWNEGKPLEDHVIHIDAAGEIMGFMSEIINAVTIVLIAFAAISLIVSLIMIAIITYISVLERTKEIGILRALGARKKDITRVFNAETFIIGACSGVIGVTIAWLLTFPANYIIEDMTNLPNVARLDPLHAFALLVLSTALTVLGGYLPARMASKRDAVEALRTD